MPPWKASWDWVGKSFLDAFLPLRVSPFPFFIFEFWLSSTIGPLLVSRLPHQGPVVLQKRRPSSSLLSLSLCVPPSSSFASSSSLVFFLTRCSMLPLLIVASQGGKKNNRLEKREIAHCAVLYPVELSAAPV
jgi:hypothetical protein